MEDYDIKFANEVGSELVRIAREKSREVHFATYDTETVRQLLDLRTLEDVRNLTRPGKLLHGALVRRGSFNKRKVDNARPHYVRRRLATQLGRVSPRFLDNSHSRECPQCSGVAVEWEGRTLCENGHTPEK